MKIRLLFGLVGLAISFAFPTFAQQTNTPDPQLREQLLALAKKVDDGWNNNDAAALAAKNPPSYPIFKPVSLPDFQIGDDKGQLLKCSASGAPG